MSRSPKAHLLQSVDRLAVDQSNVIPLRQLRSLGVTKAQWAAQVDAERWTAVPRRGIVAHNGPVRGDDALWKLLLDVGPMARLGGVTVLEVAGLTGYQESRVHIWVPKSAWSTKPPEVRLHETRRWNADDCASGGIPRSRPEVATVQAALWAVSLRQAALAMAMPIQQRIVKAKDVAVQLDRVRRHRFRRQLRSALADIIGGSESMGELDFLTMCRARGLPEPTRQVERRTSQGTIYLDVRWEAFGVSLEINGVGHTVLTKVLSDELRLMESQLRGDAAVQVSVLTLRVDPDPFFAMLAQLLRAKGWRG